MKKVKLSKSDMTYRVVKVKEERLIAKEVTNLKEIQDLTQNMSKSNRHKLLVLIESP